MNSDTRKRFKFFLEHSGYCTPPGRAACALQSARDEQWLEEMVDAGELYLHWEWDDEPYDPGDFYTREQAQEKFDSNEWTGPFGCIIASGGESEHDFYAALWGIVVGPRGTDDPYCRVVAADLASEVRAEYEREQNERKRAANQDIATVPA